MDNKIKGIKGIKGVTREIIRSSSILISRDTRVHHRKTITHRWIIDTPQQLRHNKNNQSILKQTIDTPDQ